MSYYDTNPARKSLLGHCSFGVTDMSRSKRFYSAVLAPFGVSLVWDPSSGKAAGYGWGEREPLNLFQLDGAAPHGKGTHLAFNAPSREAVDQFWEAAIANGAKYDAKEGPDVRNEIHDQYYACFVYDPDGHRLEAVYQEPVLA